MRLFTGRLSLALVSFCFLGLAGCGGRQRGGHQGASGQGEGNNPRFSHRPGPDSGRVLRDHPRSTGGGYAADLDRTEVRRLSRRAEVIAGGRTWRLLQL